MITLTNNGNEIDTDIDPDMIPEEDRRYRVYCNAPCGNEFAAGFHSSSDAFDFKDARNRALDDGGFCHYFVVDSVTGAEG